MLKTSSPHIFSKENRERIMAAVVIALFPAVLASLYFFGKRAASILAVTLISTFLIDFIMSYISSKKRVLWNGSSYVTTILLYLTLPPGIPLWLVPIGVFVSLGVKHIFGKGNSIFNPALIGRAFLLVSWPTYMTSWAWPDGRTSATPLALAKTGLFNDYNSLLIGNVAGCIGETSAIALIVGGLYLIYRRYIDYKVPVIYIGTVFIISMIYGRDPFIQILGGGLILGAFFMATDYSTTPITPKGRMIFALGCGLLTMIFRMYSSMPEGVLFSILLMNAASPMIERYTIPKPFGYQK